MGLFVDAFFQAQRAWIIVYLSFCEYTSIIVFIKIILLCEYLAPLGSATLGQTATSLNEWFLLTSYHQNGTTFFLKEREPISSLVRFWCPHTIKKLHYVFSLLCILVVGIKYCLLQQTRQNSIGMVVMLMIKHQSLFVTCKVRCQGLILILIVQMEIKA